jgi:DNA-binding NarL/FixJ family response regulator
MIANDAAEGPDPFVVLTPQELRVVELIVQGYTNRGIGENLRRPEDFVKHSLFNIFDKLNVSTRLELVMLFRQHRGQAPPG